MLCKPVDYNLLQMDALHEECGVIGIWQPREVFDTANYLVLGLTELQHRGQESAGIAVYDGNSIHTHIGMGKVREVFRDGPPPIQGKTGIGHVRYSTTGSSCVENAGPFLVGQHPLQMALAHNGNISNSEELKALMPDETFVSNTDSEVVARLIIRAPGSSLAEKLCSVVTMLRGAYSFVMLYDGKLYALRDPLGMRPLAFGKIGDAWILASESAAIEKLGGEYIRDVLPGELVEIGHDGVRSKIIASSDRHAFCVFEYIYFAGAATFIEGKYVYSVRQALGRKLAQEHPVFDADLVGGVPDSAIPAAIAYASECGLPYEEVFIKSRYAERSFIKPDQRLRRLEVDLKFSIVKPNVEGKKIVIVDDSIVRGNTMKRAVSALRRYGAKEVHLRITSPPLKHPCYYGIDIKSDEDLIAAHSTVQEIADYIGVDSLGYLSLQGLAEVITDKLGQEALSLFHATHCYGCFDAVGYPYSKLSPEPAYSSST